jgi:predicted transcriptional regulator
MRIITIGIMAQERMRARALAIARGQYKPKPGEPKIWFPSMRSVAEILSDENRALLQLIRESQPSSLGELSQLTGRQVSNLSRTLKTMSNYGLVELKRSEGSNQVRPIVKAQEFRILALA